jgi:menaquinone-dependent protoporphyrinogen IX oxidase
MKTLILYYSKFGATKKICSWLKEYLKDKDCEIKTLEEVESLDYKRILFGSPIYFGNLPKEVREFLRKKAKEFEGKTIYPFVVCILKKEKYLKKLKDYFPSAKDGKILGGKFLFINKLNKKECLEFSKTIS